MGRTNYQDLIIKVTDGVCRNLSNFILYLFFLTGSSIGKRGSKGVYQAFYETDKILQEINYDSIVAAIKNLKFNSKINTDKKGSLSLSPAVYSEIKNKTKLFQKKRIWNKKIYLILYDIPVKLNKQRKKLRSFLRSFGAAKLQDSAYLCFYNPRSVLKDFIEENNIEGTILITEMSKDSSIGEEPLDKLIRRVYNIDNLDKEYQSLYREVKSNKFPQTRLLFKYYTIYQKDPKLPYELLPKIWYGKLVEDCLININR